MILCRAWCSDRDGCSSSPAAGEFPEGAAKDMLGINPQDIAQQSRILSSIWPALSQPYWELIGLQGPCQCLWLLHDASSLSTNWEAHGCHPFARVPFFLVSSANLISPHMQPLLLSYPKAGKDQLEAFCGLSQEGPCQGPAGLDLTSVLLQEETCGQPTTLQLRPQVCQSLMANRTWMPGLWKTGRRRAIPSSLVLTASISYFLYFTFFQVLSICAMFYSLQTVLIAREDVGFALASSAKDSF